MNEPTDSDRIKEQINSLESKLQDVESSLQRAQESILTYRRSLKALRDWVLKLIKDNEPKETS